ncbi:MAG TPA: secretin and TonB N-terminal domain-containing protein [Smithellaceae bacterium]|nr:secretin and TonB N-terminal domain-containing protein [Smithellaceae bacterium]HQF83806.1 secretin and TonB N-terminal domain-containing protein [Smithellaceae bacterium]HQG80050.1 secretin and TonB N-terminal domain-containing protein [Smithellaceae bacterium]
MKKYLSRIVPVFLMLWVFLCVHSLLLTEAPAQQDRNIGYLENVLFEKFPGRERVSLVVSEQPRLGTPTIQADNSLFIKMENLFAPENMRDNVGEGQLLNVIGVRAQQQTGAGKQWVNLRIGLKEKVPYSIRQDGKLVIVDFNISTIEEKLLEKKREAARAKEASAEKEAQTLLSAGTTRRYTDRIISLDFQDADIKSVLRLMSEYGNLSIISGDDVKGKVTVSMKNVPWTQALDAILEIHGLSKKESGSVISVMTLERKKKDEADKKQAEEEIKKAEDARKARELEILIEKGKLRQILIEAKIVEASEEFVRNLGVQWGFGQHGSSRKYGFGFSGATNPLTQTGSRRIVYPAQIPWTDGASTNPLYMAAVNFPASVLGPTFGLVFGGAKGFIETQLQAMEATTQGKVISSPKVVTMDNVKAIIKQGDDVPYVTPASGNSPATVTFKEAILSLEVLPKITEEGRISMEIKATNDTPDYAQGEKLQGNPPIRKNEVESKIVVQDGDTVVIGGVSRHQDDKVESGLPWLYKVPVLGWLFKTENITRQKRQLLIFVTPKIMSGSGYVKDECDGIEELDRCRNRY